MELLRPIMFDRHGSLVNRIQKGGWRCLNRWNFPILSVTSNDGSPLRALSFPEDFSFRDYVNIARRNRVW